MASVNPTIHLSGLARRLIRDGHLDEEGALRAQTKAAKQQITLTRYLVEQHLVGAREIAVSASREFGIPLFDISALNLDDLPTKLVAENLITKHHVLPLFKRGKRLFLAVSDPTTHQAVDEIKFHTGLSIELILVEENKLAATIEQALKEREQDITDLLDDDLNELDLDDNAANAELDDSNAEIDEAPVVRFVNKVLLDAINQGVSDIHFEPYEKTYRIRFRHDGVLQEASSPPHGLADRLSARLKVMARLNIAERRVPQDGRIKLQISKHHSVDFRVNTCPTLHGEKIVLRILDAAGAKLGIEALGFDEKQQKDFMEALHKPYGMILVTGPTGSGKTVTLYTGLNLLNSPEINISTAEDPVEIQVPGINQVNVNPKTGVSFPAALRAFLRQDPDIIMVGEIRDLETAEIAVKAAQTGHLVLSTLHTNDAPQTLTRLANMGIPSYNIASSVNLILAQRLARKLCEHCKTEHELPHDVLLEEGFTEEEIAGGLTIYGPVGCDQCAKGYKGRVGIFQVVPISEEMGRLIMEGSNAMELAEQCAREGYNDLRRSGLDKVKQGITSLEEINRVTKD